MIRNSRILTIAALLGAAVGLVGFQGDVTKLTDQQIEAAIRQRLAMDRRLVDANGITVKVEQGAVTLGGTVMNLDDKLLAESIVSGTMVGIKSLKNEITVVRPVTKDDDIRKAVEAALRSVPALHESKLNKITVLVHEGDVVLKGTVEKPLHRRVAQRAAEAVRGVVSVANLLKVVGKPRPDREIEKDVVAYLQWAPYADLDQIEYKVEDGIVKLKGTVQHLADKYALANDIEKIQGVLDVDVSQVTVTKVQQKV
jgi:osmotically-inducible protein OsmY